MKPKSILAFDIDGTLTKRNSYIIFPNKLPKMLYDLTQMGHFFVPVTGKPAAYAKRLIETNSLIDSGVIAENAGVFSKPESKKVDIYEKESIHAIYELKKALKLEPEAGNLCNVFINNELHKIPVDPEDYSIFTLFTDPKFISHRWQFEQTISTEEVFEFLKNLINEKWKNQLVVLPPFPDGGIQVIRKTKSGRMIDKSLLVELIKIMFDLIDLPPIAMFGDGHNDIPAMTPKEVIPITFSNGHPDVKKFVSEKGGFISQDLAPEKFGVIEGLVWLLKKSFFREDSKFVHGLLLKSYPDIIKGNGKNNFNYRIESRHRKSDCNISS